MSRSPAVTKAPWARRIGGAALVLAVIALHAVVTNEVSSQMSEAADSAAMPERIVVAYVRTLEMSAPPRRVAVLPMRAPVASPGAAAAHAASGASAVTKRRTDHPASESRVANARTDAQTGAVVERLDGSAATAVIASGPSIGLATVAAAASAASATAASAAAAAASASAAMTSSLAAETRPTVASTAVATPSSASASSAPATSPSNPAAAFEWPVSTRVSYNLTGNYRGPVSGHAQVEWIRVGMRYQVNIDITVGPDFAPLITRRMSSDGALGEGGLVPSRYDENTKVVLRDPRHATVLFEPAAVVIANGERRERMVGVQDTASQFIQLTWLFSTRPDALRVGARVEVPLALPRGIDRWVYDVLDEETLYTSFGPVATFHLKPQRETKKPGDLGAELWFAPDLRHLPVRIRIEQDTGTFIDMVISRKPELAGS